MNILITGGAGFLGSNLAARLKEGQHEVLVIDNLSRAGSDQNAFWLRGLGIEIIEEDVCNPVAADIVSHFDNVIHLAAQVTVTDSIRDPAADFQTNVCGTLNLLEVMRHSRDSLFVYASTNKVYGDGADFDITENHALEFHSPYALSKGTADLYVQQYSQHYGVRGVILRNSCIYGPRQWGIEGQGWLAWFAQRLHDLEPLTIFGDGTQVRDVLYVDDWVRDVLSVIERRTSILPGEIFNIGGGSQNVISLLEAKERLQKLLTCAYCKVRFDKERDGDQPRYVSDISKAEQLLHWYPQIGLEEGLGRLVDWVTETTGYRKRKRKEAKL